MCPTEDRTQVILAAMPSQVPSQAFIEISYKIKAFGHAYLVHYTILFHSRGGYFNSLILQALELLPGRAKRSNAISHRGYEQQPESEQTNVIARSCWVETRKALSMCAIIQ